MAKGILENAIVLGENGLLSTTLQPISSSTDDTVYSNLQWTEEEVMDWQEYNLNNLDYDFIEDLYAQEFLEKWSRRKVFNDTFDSDGKDW